MKFLRHLLENPFITFTGLAALVHSTWSLGTLFSGVAPSGDWLSWIEWVLPAFFIAFAMDVGQISTSAKIRHYGLNWQRGLAFSVFSIATYYLQFLYIAHHMPALEIASGVSAFHQWMAIAARDAAIWILPLLLPLSTMLYTISDGDNKEQPMLEEKSSEIASLSIDLIPQAKFSAYCSDCGWEKEYDDSRKAERALNTHKSIHCKAKDLEKVIVQNGHVD